MKILGFFTTMVVAFFVIISSGFSYNLSEKQYDVIDAFEDKLFSIIDERQSVTPERVEGLLEDILERKLSDKNRAIIEVILDDLQYTYYLSAYADEVHTEDDCFEDEYFDEVDQRCYFDDGEYDYENEEDFLDQDYDISEWHNHEEEETVLARYTIDGDTISLLEWTSTQKYEDVWNSFATIIPANVRQDFKEYKVFDDADADTSAHVEQDQEDNNKWNLTVNIASLYEWWDEISQEGIATLIHEFAHVLTLNTSQVRYYPLTENEGMLERFAENCQTNLLQEWCLNEDAYLDDFIDIFWTDAEYLERVRNEEVFAAEDNPSHFITDYAGTNPGEDIAESFTYFILNKKTSGSSIADKKLNFFYNYKELDNLRKQIRTRLKTL